MIFKREIICSYKLYEKLKESFPKRSVLADANVAHDDFYYFNRLGKVRLVNTKDMSIWQCASNFPFMDRIR